MKDSTFYSVLAGLAGGLLIGAFSACHAQPVTPPSISGSAPIVVTPSGSTTAPRTISCPTCGTSSGTVTSLAASAPIVVSPNPITGAGTISCPTCGTSSGTVSSVAAGTGLSASPSPIVGAGTLSLANTAVAAGTYGDATHVPQITVDAQGRLTLAAAVAISGGSSGVTSIAAGTGLTLSPNPIVATGTVTLASINTNQILANLGATGAPSGVNISSVVALACSSTGQIHTTGAPTSVMGCVSAGTVGQVLTQAQPGGNNTPQWQSLKAAATIVWKASDTVGADTIPAYVANTTGTINSVSYLVAGGATPSFTLSVTINGTNVTGCNGLTVSSAAQTTTTCSAANTFASGGIVRVVTSAPSGTPSDAIVQINYQTP